MKPAVHTHRVRGFTLVELLISMVVASIILAAIYSAYLVQQKHYLAQSQVTEMQQNIRAAMSFITRDIRMAGYDPSGDAGAGLIKTEQDLLYFSNDLNEDGKLDGSNEYVAYDLYTSSGLSTLGRSTSNSAITVSETPAGSGHFEATNHQPVAQVIEALEFTYYDKDQNITADVDLVRTIVISILARAEQEDPDFTNIEAYPIGGPWPANDHYRRRFQQTTIQCRNLGL